MEAGSNPAMPSSGFLHIIFSGSSDAPQLKTNLLYHPSLQIQEIYFNT